MPNNYGPRIVTNGLIACLDAANTKSYPSSGTLWTNLMRSGNNGSLTNGPTFNSENGGSIVFDGVDDFVECGNFADNLGEMTVSAWFRVTNSWNGYTVIALKMSSILDGAGWAFTFVGGSKLGFGTQQAGGASYRFFNTVDALSTNVWMHGAATLTGGVNGTIQIYVNGIARTLQNQSAGTVTNTSTVTPVRIAHWGDWAGQTRYFGGNIASVSIYNRALSPTEILQNYNATKGRFKL